MSFNIQVDDNLISYLENLSCLTLTDGEKQRLSGDLKEILSDMAQLAQLDTENIPECSHPFDNTNAFRDDDPQPSFDREQILKNAPDSNEEMFIAPRTFS